jgi:hypothetical protein
VTLSISDSQNKRHSALQCSAYAECLILFTIMLNVVMLSVVMLSVIMLSVIMLSAFGVLLTDDSSRGIIYDHHVFIINATALKC